MEFKVGDIITGNEKSDRNYGVTTSEGTYEVISIGESKFSVKVLTHKDDYHIGVTFDNLLPEYFLLIKGSSENVKNSDIPNLTMEKQIVSVLVVDKKTGKEVKNTNVVAVDETSALLKAFGVDSESMFIKTSVVGKYQEEPKPVEVVMAKK